MKPVSRLVPLAALVLTLGACQQAKAPEPAVSANAAGEAGSSAPDAKPGLSLTEGRFALPAVRGNPGAAYFTVTNNGTKPAVIAAVDVGGAGLATLHQTATEPDGRSTMSAMDNPEVKPGATLAFAPGGNHVMVDGVPADWTPGATVELTLTFSDGDKLSAPLTVVAPGSAN